jgi:hypothetical protein
MAEETAPERLGMMQWSPWFNFVFLPGLSDRLGAGLVAQRALWKCYLREYALPPSALLRDDVHLNAHGEFLMGELVRAYLVRRPRHDELISSSGTVTDLLVGRDLHWKGDTLTLPFEAARVELLPGPQGAGELDVFYDGRPPSASPDLLAVTRVGPVPGTGDWPLLTEVGHKAPRVAETWTVAVRSPSPDGRAFSFSITGSVTGPDGEGVAGKRFVSRSGRVVIEPEAWTLAYATAVSGVNPGDFETTWAVIPTGLDRVVLSPNREGREQRLPVLTGVPSGPHSLTLRAREPSAKHLRGVRLHRPPGVSP